LKRSGVTQRMFGSLCCPVIWVLSFSLISTVLLFFTSTSSFYYAVLVHIFGLRNCAFLSYMQNHMSVRTGEDCLSCLTLVSLLCLFKQYHKFKVILSYMHISQWHIFIPIYINTINTSRLELNTSPLSWDTIMLTICFSFYLIFNKNVDIK